jgi:transcriptional regulator with XRE-family HTH domain
VSIGERIKQLRKEKDLPQTKFSEMVGIHLNHLRRCEADESMPSAEIIQKICRTFHVSADYLLFDEDFQSKLSEQFNDKDLFNLVKEADKLDSDRRQFIKKCITMSINEDKIKQMVS